MTRKDYQLIADAIADEVAEIKATQAFADAQINGIRRLAHRLCNSLAADYSGSYAFKRGKFIDACKFD